MIRALAVLAALLAAVAAVEGSQATFTSSARNSGGSFGTANDWVAPTITVAAPAGASLTNDNTPDLRGAAGNASGDSATVTVLIYSGSVATGTPVQTLTPTRTAATWTTTAATLADGTYTARATQTDGSGNTGTSAASTFTVDATKPTATSISAANKGGAGTTAGKLGSGDTISFTYSEAVDPTSVLGAWNGASTAVRVRFTAGLPNDTFTVLDSSGGSTIKLGTVTTNGDFVSLTTNVASTMTRSVDGTSIVVTLGTPSYVSLVAVGAKNMSWSVGSGIKDAAGNVITTPATRSETDSDVDF
jgi:hypothetical protein